MKRFEADDHLGIMVYCALESSAPVNKSHITFPHQIEIKINGDEVKANLRGLKNKPGSTRPADITKLLRVKAGYENTMLITWALTTKVSVLGLNVTALKSTTCFTGVLYSWPHSPCYRSTTSLSILLSNTPFKISCND